MYSLLYNSAGEYDDSNLLRSTYSSHKSGTCAIYITLGRLGYRVKRFKQEFGGLSKTNASLLIIPAIDTERPIKPSEWTDLSGWVRSGNTAVIFLDRSKPVHEKKEEEKAYPSFRSPLSKDVNELNVKVPRLSLMDINKQAEKKVRTFSEKTGDYIREALERSLVLFSNRDNDIVCCRLMGAGNIFIIRGAWMISNEGIIKGGNFCFLMNIIENYTAPQENMEILFDEFHNGYGENRNLWSVLPLNVKAGLVQLLIAVLLIAYTLSRRINKPVPLFDKQRTRTEYLSSMTLLFKTANATKAALDQIRERFLGELRKCCYLPGDAQTESIEKAIARKSTTKAREFAGIVDSMTKMSNKQDLPAKDIINLSSRLSKFIMEVRSI